MERWAAKDQPIGSIYDGIFAYIFHKNQPFFMNVNVVKGLPVPM